jgi:ornithine decarboxylase
VRDNYAKFARALPNTRVFYAVKANPAPEVLGLLAKLGSCFDCASVVEIQLALAAGATADRISFGNTIKKERDVLRALELGVRLFAVDCEAEVEKVSRAAGTAGLDKRDVRVFCRILCDCAGAEWPLSRKFGCAPEMAIDVLEHAYRLGLEAYGVSFHVGSQQRNTESWDVALASASAIFRECAERGIHLSMVNLGRRVPDEVPEEHPGGRAYGESIFRALSKHFGNRIPRRSSSRAAAWWATRASSSPRSCSSRRRARTRTRCAGSISTSASSAASPRRWTSRSATRSDRARRGPEGALRARRPDLRLGRRALREGALLPADLLEIGDKVLIEGTGRLHDDLFGGRLQRLPAAEELRDLTRRQAPRQNPRARPGDLGPR